MNVITAVQIIFSIFNIKENSKKKSVRRREVNVFEKEYGLCSDNFSFKNLRQLDARIQNWMTRKFPDIVHRPWAEIKASIILGKVSRRDAYKSYWITKFNYDILIPSYRSGKFKGIAIEIDGPIHRKSFKMGHDISQEKVLNELGITHLRIENEDVCSEYAINLLKNIKTVPFLDSRTKRTFLAKVFAYNIAHVSLVEGQHQFIEELFGMDMTSIEDMLEREFL